MEDELQRVNQLSYVRTRQSFSTRIALIEVTRPCRTKYNQFGEEGSREASESKILVHGCQSLDIILRMGSLFFFFIFFFQFRFATPHPREGTAIAVRDEVSFSSFENIPDTFYARVHASVYAFSVATKRIFLAATRWTSNTL